MEYTFGMTKYGFVWGPLYVDRCISDPKYGVEVRLSTMHFDDGVSPSDIYVRCSPKGRVLEVVGGGDDGV